MSRTHGGSLLGPELGGWAFAIRHIWQDPAQGEAENASLGHSAGCTLDAPRPHAAPATIRSENLIINSLRPPGAAITARTLTGAWC